MVLNEQLIAFDISSNLVCLLWWWSSEQVTFLATVTSLLVGWCWWKHRHWMSFVMLICTRIKVDKQEITMGGIKPLLTNKTCDRCYHLLFGEQVTKYPCRDVLVWNPKSKIQIFSKMTAFQTEIFIGRLVLVPSS